MKFKRKGQTQRWGKAQVKKLPVNRGSKCTFLFFLGFSPKTCQDIASIVQFFLYNLLFQILFLLICIAYLFFLQLCIYAKLKETPQEPILMKQPRNQGFSSVILSATIYLEFFQKKEKKMLYVGEKMVVLTGKKVVLIQQSKYRNTKKHKESSASCKGFFLNISTKNMKTS